MSEQVAAHGRSFPVTRSSQPHVGDPAAFANRDAATIFARATPPGRSAVAVLRVSGPRVREICSALAGDVPAPRRASLRALRDPAGEILDEALVLFFPGPASETGEDLLELQTHGSPAVIARLTELLARFPGCRVAEAGEFARRAFLNGRTDLTAVEGLADLVEAETEAQRRLAVLQARGALGALYEGWRTRLVDILALTEAGIDFVDEGDVTEALAGEVAAALPGLIDDIEAHLADAGRGERIRQGATVALVGAPNVGKSSLVNALAKRDVAIVTDVPGTTRDRIEVRLDLDGMAVTLVDTAGLRETRDVVEREGVRRARLAMEEADLVLLLGADGAPCPPSLPDVPLWRVETKIDMTGGRAGRRADGSFGISSRTGAGVPALLEALSARFAADVAVAGDVMLTQARHRAHLAEAAAALSAARIADPIAMPDLVAEELRRAARALGRITGRVDVEDVLDSVFSRLCIGK